MKNCLFMVVYFIYVTPAYAYLDPGTGSMILQALVGGIAAGLAVISIYFQRIKTLYKNLFSKSNQSDGPDEE